MNRLIFLTIAAFITLTTPYGQNASKQTPAEQQSNFDKKYWYDFDGKLGGMEIQLSIYIPDKGNVLKGNYCYKKYENKIQLEGVVKDNKIELTEFLNDKPNGYFKGTFFTDDRDRFEGTWTDASKTKQLEFKMTLQSSTHSDSPDKHYDFWGTDKDIENFMKKVKQSIAEGNKEWIANHISYSLKTTINGKKAITIKNKQQFIDNFEQIFYPAYKEKIKKLCVCNMFYNMNGIMLGNGEIWIDGKMIIAINN